MAQQEGYCLQPGIGGTIIHVLDSVSEEASGPSYSVPRLCGALAAQGGPVRLLTIGDRHETTVGFRHETYPADFPRIPVLGRLRFSRALKNALTQAAEAATVFHAHGLWRMPNIYPASVARRKGSQLVLSPRGMLGGAALEFSFREKRLFWTLAQGQAARAATCLHATSRQEYEDIRAFGLTAPIAIIPNGIDVPSVAPKRRPAEGDRTLLYLGRLHPKKGLDRLLDAWQLIEDRHPGWRLDIVGPLDGDYPNELQARIAVNSKTRVRLLGPLYGEEKMAAYRRADVFVLPTLNENFAMTIAEALAQGTPVISTKGAPWGELVSVGCGWWIDHGTGPLAATMDEAMNMSSEQLIAMGEAGRTWMSRDFNWSAIAASMWSVYRWLLGQGECPPCVVTD
jgi:glycosyltransferase involved in cell wall biosynthesis